MSLKPEDTDPFHPAAPFLSRGLQGNLACVMHRAEGIWRYPEPVSPLLQRLSTLTLLLTLPLPELLNNLDGQPMTPRKDQLFGAPDFDASNPTGFRAGIERLRVALVSSSWEFLMYRNVVTGFRAWEANPLRSGTPTWELRLDEERLEAIVTTLLEVMIYSRVPITPPDEPLPGEEPAAPRRSGGRRGGRTAKRDEP